MTYRIEKDLIGTLKISDDDYYGINTERASRNFKLQTKKTDLDFIKQVARIKKAAATANEKVGRLSQKKAEAIRLAVTDILADKLDNQFIITEIQGGAGTSTNMNVNEVITNRALEILGHKKGEYQYLSPLDDVNAGQSTNDVYPSAGKLTTLIKTNKLTLSVATLIDVLLEKSEEFAHVQKMGRTQLQEAVPTTLGNSFKAFASGLTRCLDQVQKATQQLEILNMGGTAIGTGVNTSDGYDEILYSELKKDYGRNIRQAEDLLDATQNLDSYVLFSGSLKALAVMLSKMSHDLRLLSSGPKSGFNEIELPAQQAGSSIMPGKVNPVIPEIASQAAFEVIGNDATITFAAESGELELNAFEPVIFHNLFESVDFLNSACAMMATECVKGIQANVKECADDVKNSAETVTDLTPVIGYEAACDAVKKSLKTGVDVYRILKDEGIYDRDAEVGDLDRAQ
ncbi:aspartate ammonia-lyase [Companilactobacillus ginsenosidimutans]|uniref:Aspartate ammonia-lyase n=1 Tax=Companilactobacillus ginsenosidimutans TaxID=1007676 RepID=A0A0H4QZW3_9LACO|nr:aspartate ammonia-lyase [Companilactobacillus ginsenosidimutans]AKP66985.1 aspartate ammonia-lyase [Companilactobacillus ginsenosidimutans]